MTETTYTKICPGCKKEIDKYEKVCPMCGEKFELDYEDEKALYIRDNAGFYLRKFDKMDSKNTKITWNWASFLFTDLWIIYRKMYKLFAIFILIVIAETLIVMLLGIPSIIDTLASLVLSILLGLYGNYLYRQKVEALTEEGKDMDFEGKKSLADQKGGTSAKLVIAVIVLTIVLGVFLIML